MIQITDLQGKEHYVNADLIELVESTPDTQVVLTNGHRHFARETPADIADRVLAYRRACLHPPNLSPPTPQAADER